MNCRVTALDRAELLGSFFRGRTRESLIVGCSFANREPSEARNEVRGEKKHRFTAATFQGAIGDARARSRRSAFPI